MSEEKDPRQETKTENQKHNPAAAPAGDQHDTPFPISQQSDTPNALALAEQAKTVQEIQAALVIAKRFPRDEMAAFNGIVKACQRKTLAEQALYAYKRGNELVTGPSIRLAEVLAQKWGNISFGVRELEQKDGMSICQAMAWDMETNTRQFKDFIIPHKRYTKSGSYDLRDPRDIYELVANNGARRMRACILGVIPGDIVDAAVKEIERTMEKSDTDDIKERIRKLEVAFAEIQVTKEMLEKHLGHKMEATTAQEVVKLRAVFKSIRDGFASREKYFEVGGTTEAGQNKAGKIDQMLDEETKLEDTKIPGMPYKSDPPDPGIE